MNAWFWDDVFPEHRHLLPDTTMFGIGSLLWQQNMEAFEKMLVMGSGTGVGVIPKTIPANINFAWVRGPMTAAEMGLPADRAITDGAVLCPRLQRFKGAGSTRKGTIFVPHCGTERLPLDWRRIVEKAEVDFVSPAGPAEDVIRRIAAAELVVAESMHAAIIADAFRVPWVPLALSPNFSYFKWVDWGKSVETDLTVMEGLQSFKALYSIGKRAKRMLTGQERPITANEDPDSDIRVPNLEVPGQNPDLLLDQDSKAWTKRLVGRFAPLVERALVSDLRRAKMARAYLSPDAVMAGCQDQIQERIAGLQTMGLTDSRG